MKVEQREPADFFAAISAEEFDQAMSGGDIGPDRMSGTAAIVSQIG